MRISPLQHPLAILRTHLGLGQKHFGDMVGRHWRTIQSIELGKLPLSAKLAERICDETGVNFNWLMNADAQAPMIDERGMPYRRYAYFDVQGRKLLPGTVVGQHYAIDLLNGALARLCAAVVAASQSKNIRSYTWRVMNGISNAVDDLSIYQDLEHEFNQIMVNHARDTKLARDAMIDAAVKILRQWKEPRRKHTPRPKAKGPTTSRDS